MKKFILASLLVATTLPASAAQTWMFIGVKVLAVEATDPSNDATRITLDLTGVDMSGNSSFQGCAPTREAWVVSIWDSPNQEEVMSIALAAQAQDALVDVMVNDATCSVSTTYPVFPYNYETGSSIATGGLGLKLTGIRMRLE